MKRRIALEVAAAVAAFAALSLASPNAEAGRSCEAEPPTVEAVARGLDLAERVETALASSPTDVVLLARAGQDLSRWGLDWSHLAFAVRTRDDTGRVSWRVVHKLNHCGADTASLYRQGLGPFFLDDPHRFEALWLPLRADIAARLARMLERGDEIAALHTPAYNVVAYPWSTRYQQSNQWVLEMLARAAAAEVTTREEAQRRLAALGYRPTALSIGPLTRLGARLTRANVAFDDHPNAKRFADRIETVTVESVLDFVLHAGWGAQTNARRVRLDSSQRG